MNVNNDDRTYLYGSMLPFTFPERFSRPFIYFYSQKVENFGLELLEIIRTLVHNHKKVQICSIVPDLPGQDLKFIT